VWITNVQTKIGENPSIKKPFIGVANSCRAGIYLLFDSRNEDVILFRTRENHEHIGLEERSGLSDNAKKEIKILLDLR
jgi:hypothetical protein